MDSSATVQDSVDNLLRVFDSLLVLRAEATIQTEDGKITSFTTEVNGHECIFLGSN